MRAAKEHITIALAVTLLLANGQVAYSLSWPTLPFANNKSKDKPVPPGMKDRDDSNELLDDPDAKKDTKSASASKDGDKDDDKSDGDDKDKEADKPKEQNPLDLITESDPEVFLRMAKQEVERKDYRAALQAVNKALLLNKNCWEARYLGAYVYQLQNRYKEAIVRYKEYLAVRPEDQLAHINLGVVLRKEGKLQEAEYEYRKAVQLNYYSLEAHYNLANLLIARNELEPALKELLACAKIAPSNAWVHNNLGVIYQKRDYLDEAKEEFDRALNLEPANKTFEQNLASVQEALRHKPLKAVAGSLESEPH